VTTKPAPSLDATDLEREVLALLGQNLLDLPPRFDVDSHLVDAGLDSMAVMQLLLLIEQHFGLWLPEADLLPENLQSARTLAALLARRLADGAHDDGA
jgi:acyl carrier protein